MNRPAEHQLPTRQAYRREQQTRLFRLMRPFALYGLLLCLALALLEIFLWRAPRLAYFKAPPLLLTGGTLLLYYLSPGFLRPRVHGFHRANLLLVSLAAAAQLLWACLSPPARAPLCTLALAEQTAAVCGVVLFGYSWRMPALWCAGGCYGAAAAGVLIAGSTGGYPLLILSPLPVLLLLSVSARVQEKISYSEFRQRRTAERERAKLQEELGKEELLVKRLEETRASLQKEIEERKSVERGLERIAAFDELTSVYNRRAGMEVLKEALHYARRNGLYLSVVFLDVDKLKDVNDNFGHSAGDEYLKEVVRTLRSHLRKSDSISRFGGDEFVVILTECRRTKAMDIFSRIETDLRGRGPRWGLADLSFSYGSVEAAPNDEDKDADRLIALADERMYIHKQRKKRR